MPLHPPVRNAVAGSSAMESKPGATTIVERIAREEAECPASTIASDREPENRTHSCSRRESATALKYTLLHESEHSDSRANLQDHEYPSSHAGALCCDRSRSLHSHRRRRHDSE